MRLMTFEGSQGLDVQRARRLDRYAARASGASCRCSSYPGAPGGAGSGNSEIRDSCRQFDPPVSYATPLLPLRPLSPGFVEEEAETLCDGESEIPCMAFHSLDRNHHRFALGDTLDTQTRSLVDGSASSMVPRRPDRVLCGRATRPLHTFRGVVDTIASIRALRPTDSS